MRMIAIVDRKPDVERPYMCIEEIPEGTDPDAVFDEWIREHNYDQDESGRMGYMYIHPVFGSLIQATDEPDGSDSIGYAVSEYKMNLCKTIEVEPEFTITQNECMGFYSQLKNMRD